MSNIDPLIKREMQWMTVSVNENRDLAPLIIAKVRRQRIRRAFTSVLAILLISGVSIGIYELIQSRPATVVVGGATGENQDSRPEIIGLTSDYPVTWEQSVADVSAISGAGGIGDTLGGLTAVGLKISWERCGVEQCPTSWILSVENRTADLVSTAPSLAIFTDHMPLVSNSRPTTVLPGAKALLVFTFPEFTEGLEPDGSSWQWNWYLAQLR
ncbi:unannotated protein [freshwater metagenome]|jgi:hypothetical protein|uniref:Unannotated protein n=1 Tax=freshwater metagenome TaxID=449393 RepID=A0A6J5ZCI6_9ZZZZ|nr:hypothetical protein [Actinomycetota bacterium]